MTNLTTNSFVSMGATQFVTPDASRAVGMTSVWIDTNLIRRPRFGQRVAAHLKAREYLNGIPTWAGELFARAVVEEVSRVLSSGYKPTEQLGIEELIADSIENVADRLGLPVSACIESWAETGTDEDGTKRFTVEGVAPLLRRYYADIGAELPESIDERIVVTYRAGR